MDDRLVGHHLEQVYWLGGGSGSGKSTIARRVARDHGLAVYATDDVMGDHARRGTPEEMPYLAEFIDMDMDERWANRSVEVMLETFHWFRGEGFSFIVDDLRAMPQDTRVIAEGFRLLPHLVEPLLVHPRQAVWLIPTPEFRRLAFDRMFTERVAGEAQQLGLKIIEVDASMAEDDLAERVAEAFGL
jgi:2-phosphoglycerate kinase